MSQPQVCTQTYIMLPEGKTVACTGYMYYRRDNTELYCHLCGYTIKLNLKEVGTI